MVDNTNKGKRRYNIIAKYFDFLTKKRTPEKSKTNRRKLTFKL